MGTVLARASLRGTLAQVRHVTPVHPDAATGLVAAVYAQLIRDFGMVAPPISLHSPSPAAMAAAWVMLRESLVACGQTGRVDREGVAAAVSLANACPYCVDVHTALLRGLGGGRVAAALTNGSGGSGGPSPGSALDAVIGWAKASGTQAGNARHPVPVPAGQAEELIAVAVTFQYLNRMVNVFLADAPVPTNLPASVRAGILRVAGAMMAPIARRNRPAGASLPLLAPAAPPDDLAWTAGHPAIADAFGRAAAALDAAGDRSVPRSVRDLVLTRLASWDGQPPGPSRAWIIAAATPLGSAQRAAGRLALLTAFASYQVTPADVEHVRVDGGDRAAVEITAWAAMAAARRIGTWVRVLPSGTAPERHVDRRR